MTKKPIKVKTVYEPKYMKLATVSEYPTKQQAENFISTCLKWGIGIVSCEIIEDEEKVDSA